jgi:prolyl-tRNA editing enzyme YbaK/EbsC (Cys-tRNA(Pro) deacylase)
VFEYRHGTPDRRQDVKTFLGTGPSQAWATFAAMSERSERPSDPAEHPSIAHFRTELAARGGAGRIVVLPDSVHTAALAAEALGCEVGAIANSLLFDGDGEPILILTSGAHRVDTAKAAAAVGVSALKRATPEFVREHTGQVIGGVSPIAHPRPVRTFLDPTLRRYDEIWAAAGHPAAVFSTNYDELLAMTGAAEIEVN